MRTIVSFFGILLLMGSFGIAQQQQHDNDACKFSVQCDPVHATVTGPEDIVPLVYVVEQPDSPLEIVSVDLEGMCFLFPSSSIRSGTVRSIKSTIGATESSSGSRLCSMSAQPVAQGVPEHKALLPSHLAKPSRLRLVAYVAVAEHREIT
jgi:hypothetical protein